MPAVVEIDPDLLAEAECLAIVEGHARRQGATDAQERHAIAKARRSLEVLREQGRPPRVLVAALRLETRLARSGRLVSPEEWAGLLDDFATVFESPVFTGDLEAKRGRFHGQHADS